MKWIITEQPIPVHEDKLKDVEAAVEKAQIIIDEKNAELLELTSQHLELK